MAFCCNLEITFSVVFAFLYVQWNLSNMGTLGTKVIIVLISEVSLFQGKNSMYLYKLGTRSSVGVLISVVSFNVARLSI